MDDQVEFGTCPTCGTRVLPVPALLPCGHDDEPERRPLQEPGVVYSWTRSGMGDRAGTLLVMADFLDGELRVTAPLVGADEVAIGDRVVVVAGRQTPYALAPAST